jgi:SOS-response transcriptional repressors (RecA-mediated autopeptidases)
MFRGDRLKKLRDDKNLTQTELGKAFSISDATINRYEKNQRQPDTDTLNKLADYFNVTVDYLLGRSDFKSNVPDGAIKVNGFVRIPVLGVIRAGEPMYAEQNIIDYEYVATLHLPQGECFFLKVVGDSMNLSNIVEGSLVLVRVQEEVENGEIAVVLVNGDDATVKRFYKNGNTVTLMPNSTNQAH